jgi:tail assembly chaperone
MIQTAEKEIDGHWFQVGGLDLRTERALYVRLARVVGPALAELARAGNGPAAAPGALRAVFEGLDEAEVDFLIDTFKKVTKVAFQSSNGSPVWVPYQESVFESAASQFKWLWFCLEHQFADFLGSSSGKIAELVGVLQTKASGSSSPKT